MRTATGFPFPSHSVGREGFFMIMRKAFTTGQVARLCAVSDKTVRHWIDTGLLEGWRIPGSTDRRVSLQPLCKFMRLHGFPLGKLEFDGATRALILSSANWTEALKIGLQAKGLIVHVFHDLFEAGLKVFPAFPDFVILDLNLASVSRVRSEPSLQGSLFFAVSPVLDSKVFEMGVHDAFTPLQIDRLIDRIISSITQDQIRQSWQY